MIQIIDGAVIIDTPTNPRHQRNADAVRAIFHKYNGHTLTAPIEVCLDEANVFVPDVVFLKPDNPCVIDDQRLTGAPDLVVEVLSPGTARYDRQQKYDAYQRHGVGEYWIVDPLHEVIEVWTLDTDGQFQRQSAFAGEDRFESVTLSESIAVNTIFVADVDNLAPAFSKPATSGKDALIAIAQQEPTRWDRIRDWIIVNVPYGWLLD